MFWSLLSAEAAPTGEASEGGGPKDDGPAGDRPQRRPKVQPPPLPRRQHATPAECPESKRDLRDLGVEPEPG